MDHVLANLHWNSYGSPLRRAAELGGQERQDDARLLTLRVGLRVPDPRQRLSRPQAGHQSPQEGPKASDARRQDEPIDQENHLPRASSTLWDEKRLCCIVKRTETCNAITCFEDLTHDGHFLKVSTKPQWCWKNVW
jgi:hypothetical protein